MTPLTITLPAEVFALVVAGEKKVISTKRNPRKDRYFAVKTPDMAKINGRLWWIARIEGTATEWHVHLGVEIADPKTCKHPPARLYAWNAGKILCVCCCLCGAVLAGGAN